jgi:hypothetical protein
MQNCNGSTSLASKLWKVNKKKLTSARRTGSASRDFLLLSLAHILCRLDELLSHFFHLEET